MSASAALLQFAAEFVLFLAAAAGLGSLLLQGRLGNDRTEAGLALAAGYGAFAISAILRGSDLAGDPQTAVVAALRGGGAVVAFAGSLRWSTGVPARRVLWVALALLGGAGVADAADQATLTGLILAVGGGALGLSVWLGSRRSVAARVATSAAGTLLIVVLVLGVALSAVLLDTLEDAAIDRLVSRANNEAENAEGEATRLAGEARVVAGGLSGQALRPAIERLAGSETASAALTGALTQLSENVLSEAALAYVARGGFIQGAVNLESAQVVELAGSIVVREALASAAARESVEVLAGEAFAVRVEPVPLGGTGSPLGVAVAVAPLDRTYLERSVQDDQDLSLALVSRDGVVATFRARPALGAISGLVEASLQDGRPMSRVVGGRFVAVAPIERTDDRTILALVASSPTSQIADTRDDLFRYLFLVALGGTLLALLLASQVGSGVGSRLRRLTGAAESIRRGDLAARTGMAGDDEVGVLGATFDAMAGSLQEKTSAESALLAQREAVLAGIREALIAVDGRGRITEFNGSAEQLVGLAATVVIGQRLEDAMAFESEGGDPLFLRPPGSSGRWSARGYVRRPDGRRVPVDISVGALAGGGPEVAGQVVVLRDLGPEREVERMKTEFLNRVGHEFRHPLVPIMNNAVLLRAGPVPTERAQQWGREILTQSRALMRLVQLQEFFVSAAGGFVELDRRPVEIGVIVDDAVKRWRARVDSNLVVSRRIDAGLPVLLVDQDLMARCLEELIDNADKFRRGAGRITVSATAGARGFVTMSVKDRGIGMTADEQDEAIELFHQGDSTDTRQHGGMGVGLTFVYRVVNAHGGTLAFDSSPGSGTKVSISVPTVPTEKER